MSALHDTHRQAFLDSVLADAEGTRDNEKYLVNDVDAWRVALIDLLDEVRGEIAEVNAELKADMPNRRARFERRGELEAERARLAERQRALDTKLRHIKLLLPNRNERSLGTGTPLEQARAHLFAAIDILTDLNRLERESARECG